MSSKKIITISAYDRTEYFRETLEHLSRCYGIDKYKVFCFIDPSPNTPEISKICQEFYENQKLVIGWHVNENVLDCNGNIFRCLEYGFRYTDYLIHIEDDIVLAKDALRYFEHCGETYANDRSIFSVCSYNRYSHRSYQPTGLTSVYKQKHFDPWGWATWRDRWEEEIKDNWQFGYGPRYNKEGEQVLAQGGWDVNMGTIIRSDQRRINPNCSRSKNIGEHGRHTPSVEYHRGVHKIEWWSDDFSLGRDVEFVEGEMEVQHD